MTVNGCPADAHVPSHDLRFHAEAFDPEPVAEHDHWMAAPRPIIGVRKQPALQRPYAEHVEVVPTDDARDRPFGDAIDRQIHGIGPFRDQAGEHVLLGVANAAVRRVRPGQVPARPPVAQSSGVQENQLARVIHGQRLEQQGVDDADDRGVCTDAEREREHHHDREARLGDEPTTRVTDVLPAVGHHEPPPSFLSRVIVQALRPAIDVPAGVRPIDIRERRGELCPVRDLRAGVGVGLGLRHAAREPLAIEVFELRRQLAHDTGFAFADEARQRQMCANVSFPITHATAPSPLSRCQ